MDLIVDKIQEACEDVGGGQGRFVTEEDVVRYVLFNFFLSIVFQTFGSLDDARRMTSVNAKMVG